MNNIVDFDLVHRDPAPPWRRPAADQAGQQFPPAGEPAPDAVRTALQLVLGSDLFCKAQRMRRLLHFLVEKRLASESRETGEYAIGIQVFDRDPATYDTSDDPIVRVQMGRLRDKLKAYYESTGRQAALRFSIPMGSYMPEIHASNAPARIGDSYLLAMLPLQCFDDEPDGRAFAGGLNEELAFHLYRVFGQQIVAHTFTPAGSPSSPPLARCASHRLEGSVRVDGATLRVSLRLVDSTAGCIAWCEQFDRCSTFSIGLQEELAMAICDALIAYFSRG